MNRISSSRFKNLTRVRTGVLKDKGGKFTDVRLLGRIAAIEQFLEALKNDLESAEFRPNEIVKNNLDKGWKEIERAVASFSSEKLECSERASSLAWLHAYFARSIFDAEVTEHYLGEGDFLELDDTMDDWREFVFEELKLMEQDIVALRNEIKASRNGKR